MAFARRFRSVALSFSSPSCSGVIHGSRSSSAVPCTGLSKWLSCPVIPFLPVDTRFDPLFKAVDRPVQLLRRKNGGIRRERYFAFMVTRYVRHFYSLIIIRLTISRIVSSSLIPVGSDTLKFSSIAHSRSVMSSSSNPMLLNVSVLRMRCSLRPRRSTRPRTIAVITTSSRISFARS